MRLHLSILAAILFLSTASQALNPKRSYDVTPADFGMDYEDVKITTEDLVKLHAWFFRAPKMSGRAIILSHNGNGNMADLIELAGSFISMGFNVLTYDYRGYGRSDDFEINNNFFIYAQFEKDLSAAINYILTKKGGITNLMLYGQGIGAGLSLAVGSDNRRVTKIIADSPYTSFTDVQKRIKEVSGAEPLIPLAYNKNMLEPLYGLEKTNARAKDYLFIGGEKEEIFQLKDIRNLMKLVKNTSTLYVVKGATAASTFSFNKKAYFEEIRKFVQ